MSWSGIAYDISAFIAGLFLLEWGADVFIDNTAVVARRLGVSQTLVALLTACAEWEELAVVIASILQNKSSLAVGNVIGSSISNILGAFSLGLVVSTGTTHFDRSAKIYTTVLFIITSIVTIVALVHGLGRIFGIVSIVSFVVYVSSIAYLIYKGSLAPPEDSDSDSDSDVDSSISRESSTNSSEYAGEATTLLQRTTGSEHRTSRSLAYYVLWLVLGFLALSVSGFVLSHSAASLAATCGFSDSVVGITILAFATTLPEKFVAVVSGSRGHGGIFVANTAGSNTFLLTLCLGIILVSGNSAQILGSLGLFELLSAWLTSFVLFLIVLIGARRWMGWLLLAFYVGFIAVEFAHLKG